MRTLSICLAAMLWAETDAAACPFCGALKPTLIQQREQAAVVALGELLESGGATHTYRLHHVLKGEALVADKGRLTLPADQSASAVELAADAAATPARAGTLALLLGRPPSSPDKTAPRSAADLEWRVMAVNEVGYVYVARAPAARLPAHERLKYFARYLEHADPLVAEDAYLEFGHAPYDEVARVADCLSMPALRRWLRSEAVPPARKGFYGLALGLAKDPQERQSNAEFLRDLILEPASDFRSGFDGLLGGYLVAAGEPGLELIERKLLSNPTAAHGDVRHAMTALRFYHEFGREIPPNRLHQAMRGLLDRPEFAAAAIVDLARWKDWQPLERIAGLFVRPEYSDPLIQRAVIGYLAACPDRRAREQLSALRKRSPERVAEAEKHLLLLGGGR